MNTLHRMDNYTNR